MKSKSFTITTTVKRQDVEDLIGGADIAYWTSAWERNSKNELVIQESDECESKPRRFTLTDSRIKRGLNLMATQYSKAWAAFITGDYDAETGDVFVQLCCFGEVKYG